MKNIQRNLTDETKRRANQEEKMITYIAALIFLVVWFSYFAEIYGVVTTLKTTGLDAFMEVSIFISIFISFAISGTINTMIQFSYFNFCVYLRAWFRQVEEDFSDLNSCRNDKQVTENVKKLVNSQYDIFKSLAQMQKSYSQIVNLIFITSIFFLGMTLISSVNSDWFQMATTIPFVLFDAWVFCYGSQLILNQVKCKS